MIHDYFCFVFFSILPLSNPIISGFFILAPEFLTDILHDVDVVVHLFLLSCHVDR